MTQFEKDSQIKTRNNLEGITEVVVFSLDELDNTNNLENGSPSYTLFVYHVTTHKDSTDFKLYTLQYKKLMKGELVSLALRIKHTKNNTMTDTIIFSLML